MPLEMRSPTLNLIPHTLHVMQVVGLIPVLSKQGSCLLCLLYLPCPKLPLGSLAVYKPAVKNNGDNSIIKTCSLQMPRSRCLEDYAQAW